MAATHVVDDGRDQDGKVHAAEVPELTPRAAAVLLRILLKAARRKGLSTANPGSRGDAAVSSGR
ncbi:MAG: hypothetical protein ACRDXD_08940 [Acidimicrobiia bacterium]